MEEAYPSIRREIIQRSVINNEAPTSKFKGVGGDFALKRSVKTPVKQDDDKANLRCSHCGELRHTKEGCFKLFRYPEWWPESKKGGTKKKTGALASYSGEAEKRDNEEEKKGSVVIVMREGNFWEGKCRVRESDLFIPTKYEQHQTYLTQTQNNPNAFNTSSIKKYHYIFYCRAINTISYDLNDLL